MDKYQVRSVTILNEDRDKVDAILEKHYHAGDIDEMHADISKLWNGDELVSIVTYWIYPYICEDLGIIVDKIKQAGIQVL